MYYAPSRIAVFTRRRARIEIVPLIDVVFFLLATFVLATLSLSLIRTLPVSLPRGGPAGENPGIVTLQVSGEGAVYWNHELIAAADVPARLAHYKTETDNPRVLITGDEHARFGATVDMIEALRMAGIDNFSVGTRTRPTGR